MNEHDSERLAGLLVADGLVPRHERSRGRRGGAQHLHHPRERRPQALQRPRPPEGVEGGNARTCRSPSAAAWPRRTAARSSERASLGRRRLWHAQPRLRAGVAASRASRRTAHRGPGRARPARPTSTWRRPFTPCARCPTPRGSPSRRAVTTPALLHRARRCADVRSVDR